MTRRRTNQSVIHRGAVAITSHVLAFTLVATAAISCCHLSSPEPSTTEFLKSNVLEQNFFYKLHFVTVFIYFLLHYGDACVHVRNIAKYTLLTLDNSAIIVRILL